uniref:Uncharacterized protein n=1 Tax=Solanum lycopersicum TaxID=4081 RepID=A0A3Q7GIM8_SOLLC
MDNPLKGKLPDSLSHMRSSMIYQSINFLVSSLLHSTICHRPVVNYFSGNLRSNIGVAFPKAEKINWGMN